MSFEKYFKEETKEQIISEQENLKEGLLSSGGEEQDFRDFKKSWLDLDQRGDHTEQAIANIKLLEDIELVTFFKKKDKYIVGLEKERSKMLSVSYFHAAQTNLDIDFFRKAYEYSLENEDDPNYKSWIQYTKGTLAYLEKDREGLKVAIQSINISRNKEILKNLLDSLLEDEDPRENYLKTYGK